MSNYGFHQAMEEAGIEVATTPVGDRHVIAELASRGWTLGGEQSGHIIWTDYGPTGDGIAAALLVAAGARGRELAAAIPMQKLPQLLENVEIPDRGALEAPSDVWEAVERESAGARGPWPRAGAPLGHGAARPRDGRSADEEECDAGRRAPGRHRRARAG